MRLPKGKSLGLKFEKEFKPNLQPSKVGETVKQCKRKNKTKQGRQSCLSSKLFMVRAKRTKQTQFNQVRYIIQTKERLNTNLRVFEI